MVEYECIYIRRVTHFWYEGLVYAVHVDVEYECILNLIRTLTPLTHDAQQLIVYVECLFVGQIARILVIDKKCVTIIFIFTIDPIEEIYKQ